VRAIATFREAAVQASYELMNRDATIGRVAELTAGAAFLAVLADRLQQPVAALGPGFPGHHQRTRHQARQQFEHRAGIDALPAADRLGGLQGAAAREHRQPAQQSLLGLGEQLEGPVDRGPQRLVTCHRAPPATREHRETPVQAAGQLGRGHRGHPRRRQLDRQRHPIQALDHCGDRRRVLGGHLEPGLDRGRAFGEQAHRRRVGDRLQIGIRARYRERRHRDQPLPRGPAVRPGRGRDGIRAAMPADGAGCARVGGSGRARGRFTRRPA
jgi:hypothetical protein